MAGASDFSSGPAGASAPKEVMENTKTEWLMRDARRDRLKTLRTTLSFLFQGFLTH